MDQHDASLAEKGLQATWDALERADADRRRPERLDHVNPTLIPLLRGALAPGLPLNDRTDLAYDREERAPASRFAVIIALSAFLWAVIGFIGWAILH